MSLMPQGLSWLAGVGGPAWAKAVVGEVGAAVSVGASASGFGGVWLCCCLLVLGVGEGFDIEITPPWVKRKSPLKTSYSLL